MPDSARRPFKYDKRFEEALRQHPVGSPVLRAALGCVRRVLEGEETGHVSLFEPCVRFAATGLSPWAMNWVECSNCFDCPEDARDELLCLDCEHYREVIFKRLYQSL